MLRNQYWVLGVVLSAAVLGLDRLSKVLIEAFFHAHPGPLVLTSWFNLVLAYNRGAAFSLLAEGTMLPRILFSVVAIVASGFIITMMRRQPEKLSRQLGLALILGGALGNLWDRLSAGAVVDFVQWHWQEFYWPAFNVADSAITVGAAILVILSVRNYRGKV